MNYKKLISISRPNENDIFIDKNDVYIRFDNCRDAINRVSTDDNNTYNN
ncbi:hypothetical protein SDC9_12356 [bioreactor metagenome]|uniref:Uncharacterized protein n=1 Tax=bioreactor metagenome TaxID=1076179 RepID=A0A644TIZ9_9ZZZZ